ncbi:Cytochrome c-type biogenesis protein CcmF, mitochondrion, partial [Thalictrum thalictroides]
EEFHQENIPPSVQGLESKRYPLAPKEFFPCPPKQLLSKRLLPLAKWARSHGLKVKEFLFGIAIAVNPFDLLMAMGPLDVDWISYFDNNGGVALESSSSSESLETFRAQIAGENEAEIYQRIRLLENNNYYNLPPQNASGDYERLVREHFDQAINVNHFREILDREYFELRVLERKGLLQERLFNLMLGEPKIDRIMELSHFNNVQKEAYNFIEEQVSAVSSLRHSFQRDLIDGNLNSFIIDLNQNGAEIYRAFYSHFVDEEFRRTNGLPLP